MASNVLDADDLELEQMCWNCNGRGTLVSFVPCDFCDGTGYQVTEFGKKILDFVGRRLKSGQGV